MSFFLSCAALGVILAIAPVMLSGYFRQKWKMPKWLLLKAAVAMLIVEIFHIIVVLNYTVGWLDYAYLPDITKALLSGVAAGLFYELGRYMFLDKVFKNIRSWREGVYFGIAWTALFTVFFGVLFFLMSFSADALMNTKDLSTIFPNTSATDLEQIKSVQEQFQNLAKEDPNFGITIVFERMAIMLIDIVLTLITLLAFKKGSTKYVWISVMTRILFVASVVYVSNLNALAGTILYPAYALLAYFGIRYLKDLYSEP